MPGVFQELIDHEMGEWELQVLSRLSKMKRTLLRFPMQLTGPDILIALGILISMMLVVVLYHVLFIVVDLRKIVRRLNDVSTEVESMILKPISVADQLLQWGIEYMNSKKGHHKKIVDHDSQED